GESDDETVLQDAGKRVADAAGSDGNAAPDVQFPPVDAAGDDEAEDHGAGDLEAGVFAGDGHEGDRPGDGTDRAVQQVVVMIDAGNLVGNQLQRKDHEEDDDAPGGGEQIEGRVELDSAGQTAGQGEDQKWQVGVETGAG